MGNVKGEINKKKNDDFKVVKNNTKGKKKMSKKKKVLITILIIIVAILVIGAGIAAGLMAGVFGDEYKITKDDLIVGTSNSVIYDVDGNVLATLNSDQNRKIIKLEEMPEYLPKAFVSIEDERFYKHNGVDLKRTAAATVNFVIHKGNSSFGGSTITQQLVKNITQDKDNSGFAGIKRKISEMTKAYQVESILSKDQILEMYLNIIFLGKTNYGVEAASVYYFNKNASDLSLAESAFIAGITHTPNSYNPFNDDANMDKIKTRTKTVLSKMKELDYVSEEQYDQAVQEVDNGMNFQQGQLNADNAYSYHTEACIKQIVDQFKEEKGWDEEYAKTYVCNSGLRIYSTEDPKIQGIVDDVHNSSKYILKSRKVSGATTQAASVIIDQKTGYVVAVSGGLGARQTGDLNRATQCTRQTGSSMKPLAVIAPSLEKGIITASTVMDDTPSVFGTYTPHNYYSGYKGLSNIRYMIRISENITEVKLLQQLTPASSIAFLKQLGITSLDDKKDNNLSIALGGLTYGISPLEMAAAYATIANDGVYIEPTFYMSVEDPDGKTILEPKQESRRVLSEGNAFILKSILTEPIVGQGGTGTSAAMSGMDVAGKTGTTNDDFDGWFCGFTPYYTGATWFGYDNNEKITSSTATKIWSDIMKPVHKDLQGARFQQPDSVTTAVVCRDSGMLATDLCRQDPRGDRTYTEFFVKGTVPTESCTSHVTREVCASHPDFLAGENCRDKVSRVFITRPDASINLSGVADAQYMAPTQICNECGGTTTPEPEKTQEPEKKEEEKKEEANTSSSTNNQAVNNDTNSGKLPGGDDPLKDNNKPSTPVTDPGTSGNTDPKKS